MSRIKLSVIFLSYCWIAVIRSEVCTTSQCIQASSNIIQRFDSSVDPCDNFYDFACGSFIQENYPADESVAVDTFTLLKDNIQNQVFSLLVDNDERNPNASLKLARELLKTCLDRQRESDSAERRALREIVKELGGWPLIEGHAWDATKWSLSEAVSKIRDILGSRTDEIFKHASFINLENGNNPSLRSSKTFFSLRNAYFSYIKDLSTFLGATGDQLEDELNQLLDFEYQLNTISLKYQHLSESSEGKALPDFDLIKQISSIQWLSFFNPSQMQNLLVQEIKYSEGSTFGAELESLLNKTSRRTLANFAMLRVVDFAAAQSISELSEIHIRFQRLIDGRQDYEQKWKECVDVLSENLPFAVGKVYIDNFFTAETKANAEDIFSNVKDEFAKLIVEADWIDKDTKSQLLNTLKALVLLIAYPDSGFSETAISELYEGVTFEKRQYLRALFQLRIIDADNKFRQTYTSTALESSNAWKKYLPPTSATALYSQSDNTIRFSAGILQSVRGTAYTINYLEYGASGFIIAHEISHIVNQIFNDASRLSEAVEGNFTARKQCLIEQYSAYREPETSMNLNGERTVIENFADNTGIRLAYRAYRVWKEKFTGIRENLIGLDYTWDQLFWLSAAQTWCGTYREEEVARKILSGNYATERFRVIGPISNSPDFARDFNCSKSSSMNRENKCIIL